MATYSKETALYDTGAIGAGIAGAENNGKKEATNYIYAGSDGIKIANADPEHADTYQKQTAESTEFYVDGVKRSDVSGSGLDVFAEDGSTKNASFGATSFVGRKDDYNISIAPENFELNSGSNNGGATLFRVGASGNPTSEIYQKTEHLNLQEQTVLSDTPVSGSTITVKIIYFVGPFDLKSQTLTFTAGTSATKAWAEGNVKYTSPRTFEYSGSVFLIEVTYSVQADAIDLGILQFGSRQDGGAGNNSATIGNELVAPYSYQTVVGKHNAPVDAPFVVGIGNPLENKNGVTIDWNGTIRTHKNSMKTLLSTASYMGGNQDLTFSEPVSEQLTGIVLVWSWWSGSQAEDWGWETFFVPKAMVQLHDVVAYDCPLSRPKSSYFGNKFVYIYDTHIKGHADNVATGKANNVPYSNNKWVLRYVFGC